MGYYHSSSDLSDSLFISRRLLLVKSIFYQIEPKLNHVFEEIIRSCSGQIKKNVLSEINGRKNLSAHEQPVPRVP